MLIPHFGVIAVFLAIGSAAPAQTYTVKLKTHPDPGQTVTIRKTETETGSIKYFDADGKLLNEIKPTSKELVYTLTVLEHKPGETSPSKYRRAYEKATETTD